MGVGCIGVGGAGGVSVGVACDGFVVVVVVVVVAVVVVVVVVLMVSVMETVEQ